MSLRHQIRRAALLTCKVIPESALQRDSSVVVTAVRRIPMQIRVEWLAVPSQLITFDVQSNSEIDRLNVER